MTKQYHDALENLLAEADKTGGRLGAITLTQKSVPDNTPYSGNASVIIRPMKRVVNARATVSKFLNVTSDAK